MTEQKQLGSTDEVLERPDGERLQMALKNWTSVLQIDVILATDFEFYRSSLAPGGLWPR
jgi:hypothetical protein